ncbi:MAG: hypothetical protein ACI3WU_05735 [Phascolarctobacterium sp.]
MSEVFMSIKEYAQRAGCGYECIRLLCCSGVIPSMKIGRKWSIDVAAADAYFKEQMQQRCEKTAPMRYAPRVAVIRSTNVRDSLENMQKTIRNNLHKSVEELRKGFAKN